MNCICLQISAKPVVNLCLTGRMAKSLPAYEQSFTNATHLAYEQSGLTYQINIKTYFYDNKRSSYPLEQWNFT